MLTMTNSSVKTTTASFYGDLEPSSLTLTTMEEDIHIHGATWGDADWLHDVTSAPTGAQVATTTSGDVITFGAVDGDASDFAGMFGSGIQDIATTDTVRASALDYPTTAAMAARGPTWTTMMTTT